MGRFFLSAIFSPLRLLARIFRAPFRVFKRGNKKGEILRKSSASFIANQSPDLQPSSANPPQTKMKTLFFRELERPRLVERVASELTLDEAREEVAQAERFYTNPFTLFPSGALFYEEVEQDYLHNALGGHESENNESDNNENGDNQARDARFIVIMDQYRRTLNDNSRRLLVYFTPIIFAFSLFAALLIAFAVPGIVWPQGSAFGLPPQTLKLVIAFSASLIAGLIAVMLLYRFAYKITQQRNLLGLDNFITSKFSRINQSFLVAKRQALNVERNKRMPQAEQLKGEAGIWTLTYQWFAYRLLLCEGLVRNAIYQVRRNMSLYAIGNMILSIGTAAIAMGIIWNVGFFPAEKLSVIIFIALTTGLFLTATHGVILRHIDRETLASLQANEWSRFHTVELHKTIAEHVGEDKLQIVTFRDRNRFE
jgi:hypothetical protein